MICSLKAIRRLALHVLNARFDKDRKKEQYSKFGINNSICMSLAFHSAINKG